MKYCKNTILVFGCLLTFILTSCKDQVFNQSPIQSFGENQVWSDIELVKKYVWNNYNAFGGWGVDTDGSVEMPASLTDDAYILFDYGLWVYNTGKINPTNMGAFASMWGTNYKYIRNVNIFMSRIDDVEASEAVKKRLKGEMKFIRAWCYAELANWFGGVPILTKVFKLHSNYAVERASYEETINYIVQELNEAKNMVPETVAPEEWGRVTKGAVLALKSQVLLYAASKLHDPSSKPSGPLYTYDKPDKWKAAAEAAKAVIDMAQYSLVQVDNWQDYQNMFLHKTPEIIFAKPRSSQYSQETNIGLINTPNGYGGWSGNVPVQDLVNSFQMKDGKPIDESPLYNPSPSTIYKNRELRFYANIVYQGASYRGRETEFYLPGGLDSPDGPQAWNYARSGYAMRKHMNESVDFKATNPKTPTIYFRLAEFYLNYAEAQYHLGNEAIAREYVNKIRNRVHLPDIHSTGKELLKDIRHERRIELVFEGFHRINDLRRWMRAENQLSEDATGIAWTKVNAQGEPTVGGDLVYEIVNVQNRNFKKRMYYLPIPQSEINKTDLKQNWGYN